jgi:hypothetical protein
MLPSSVKGNTEVICINGKGTRLTTGEKYMLSSVHRDYTTGEIKSVTIRFYSGYNYNPNRFELANKGERNFFS